MHYLKNYTKKIFSEAKSKRIRIFLLVFLLILPLIGFADFKQDQFSSTYSNPNRNQQKKYFWDDEVLSEDALVDSENASQQKIEQIFTLCQIAQKYWQRGEPDKAIDLLDQAYSNILEIETFDNEDLMRQKEDMRFVISKRIYEIYASREFNISGRHNEIPVIINKRVQHEIDLYTKGNLRAHFIASYKRSGKYRQMIVELLKNEGLPKELSWLPLVESGFVVNALSGQRALGLWQFIPSTGYKFGLKRNEYIDERLDPKKSTQAAIEYFKELHSHFGDWSTSLAAYNCGENRVLRIIRNQKINYLDNFWDLYEQLPQETARYVPKFLAIVHIVNNLEKYGFEEIKIDQPLKYEPLIVTKKIKLEEVSRITGIDNEILAELNPELRQNIVPGGNYTLKIPEGKRKKLYANIDKILRLNPASVDCRQHQVKSGETLSLIADRYSTSIENIVLANNLQRVNHIVSGRMIKIPYKINFTERQKLVTLMSGNS
jgi:membrane-bound lytic murein transglycosylase D